MTKKKTKYTLAENVGQSMSTSLYDDMDYDILPDIHRVWNGCYVGLMDEQWRVERVLAYNGMPTMCLSCVTKQLPNHIVSIEHPKLIKEYPQLGYFNLPTTSVYISRLVNRQWKQGFHDNTVSYWPPFHEIVCSNYPIAPWQIVGIEAFYEEGFEALARMINVYNHTYPCLNEALILLQEEHSLSVALSHDVVLAIHPSNGEIHVMYHDMSVGALNEEANELLIKDEFRWLEDSLREVITV